MQLANHVAERSTKPARASMQLANRLAERTAKPVGVAFRPLRYHCSKELERHTGRVDATRQSCG